VISVRGAAQPIHSTFFQFLHLASMFIAVFATLFATLSAEGMCDAVGTCREEESLLQAAPKGEVVAEGLSDSFAGIFCPDFFQDEDIEYASMGVQQAQEIFMKYCAEIGIAHELCEDNAEGVFGPVGGAGQELTKNMCTDLVALSTWVTEKMFESPPALLARLSDGAGVPPSEIPSEIDRTVNPKVHRRRSDPTPAPTETPTHSPGPQRDQEEERVCNNANLDGRCSLPSGQRRRCPSNGCVLRDSWACCTSPLGPQQDYYDED